MFTSNLQIMRDALHNNKLSIKEFPKDVLGEIVRQSFNLPDGRRNLFTLSQVNSTFYELCSADEFWNLHNRLKYLKSSYSSQDIIKFSPRIRKILSKSKKETIIELRNKNISATLSQKQREYYKKLSLHSTSPLLDVILLLCLFIFNIFWLLSITNIISTNNLLTSLPLVIFALIWCYTATMALIMDWTTSIRDRRFHHHPENPSGLFIFASRALQYFAWNKTPRYTGCSYVANVLMKNRKNSCSWICYYCVFVRC
jgi:hypothetical protein